MNWLDCVLIAIVGLSSGLALLRGLVREIMGLLVWVGSLMLASRIGEWAAEVLRDWPNESQGAMRPPWADMGGVTGHLGAFLILFVVSSLAIRLLAAPVTQRLQSLASRAGLSWADRLFGLAFGLARGVCVILLGFLILQWLNISEPMWMSRSQLAPLTRRGASYLAEWLPEGFLPSSDTWLIVPTHSDALIRLTPGGRSR
jgi:membrane protein required for colicin V production